MKNFLNHYGLAMLTAIVIATLLYIATPIGSDIRSRLLNLGEVSNDKTKETVVSTREVITSASLEQLDHIGNMRVIITSNSTTDEFDIELRYKTEFGEYSDWVLQQHVDIDEKERYVDFTPVIPIQDGFKVQARVTNTGNPNKRSIETNEVTCLIQA